MALDQQIQRYIRRISKTSSLIPIISNSFQLGNIFREQNGNAAETVSSPATGNSHSMIDKMLTKRWAVDINYPLERDKDDLVRVAQYWQVENKDRYRTAKQQYIDSLKTSFLDHVEKTWSAPSNGSQEIADLSERKALLKNLRLDIESYSFSQLAVDQLSYARFIEDPNDPLRLLAKLELPIYITTSPFDFLERAIVSESGGKKTPRKQVCSWGGVALPEESNYKLDYEFIPSKDTPAVYHLYGLEDFPESLVLSEDDYLNFLISMFQDNNNTNPPIPSKLRFPLATISLLLLGYRLYDWDFRVLFRFLLKFRQRGSERGFVIQLSPDNQEIETKFGEYLTNYFNNEQFDLIWEEAETFTQTLSEVWDYSK